MSETSKLEKLVKEYTDDGLNSTFVELESHDSSLVQCERKMLFLDSLLNSLVKGAELTKEENVQFSREVYIRVQNSEYVKPFKISRWFTLDQRHYIVDNTGMVLCLETNIEILKENIRLIEMMNNSMLHNSSAVSTMIRHFNARVLSTFYPSSW